MVLTASWSSSASVFGVATVIVLIGLSSSIEFQGRYFAQAAEMTGRVAELRGQERLNKIPRDGGPDGAAPDADDVHVIVLDALSRGKVVMNQSGTGARNLVRADRGTDAATADGNSALHRTRRHRLRERDDEVRIVVVGAQLVRPEINDIMSGSAQTRGQVLLQLESPMIGRDSHVHDVVSAIWFQRPDGPGAVNEWSRSAPAASWSASTRARPRLIRPAGIERSAVYRRASMSAFSGPVTSQTMLRARFSMG